MSVVLLGPSGSLGRAILARLLEQGDEVRVIDDDPAAAEGWKALGGYVALAQEWDADLIERAAHGARTIVVFERRERDRSALLDAVVQAAEASSLDRIILVTSEPEVPSEMSAAGIDYVVLARGKRSMLRRKEQVDDERIALAIDAADDISGSARLALDLTKPDAWARLGL